MKALGSLAVAILIGVVVLWVMVKVVFFTFKLAQGRLSSSGSWAASSGWWAAAPGTCA